MIRTLIIIYILGLPVAWGISKFHARNDHPRMVALAWPVGAAAALIAFASSQMQGRSGSAKSIDNLGDTAIPPPPPSMVSKSEKDGDASGANDKLAGQSIPPPPPLPPPPLSTRPASLTAEDADEEEG